MTPTEAVNYLAQVTPALPVPLPVHQQVLMALEVLRKAVPSKDTASYGTVEVKNP